MNLKHLSNQVLRSDAKRAAKQEKGATAVLLHYIKEVDRRKLYCDWKFTSLFEWCVKELDLCSGSAQLRITAARLLEDIPEIEEKIEEGLLNLTNIGQVNQFCRENNIKSLEEKKEILKEVESLTKRETEKKLFELSGKKTNGKEGKRRISSNQSKVSLILSDDTMDALEEVRALIGREMSSDELVKLMACALKEKVEKEKFKQVERPRRAKGTKGRIIPAQVKRAVYLRDKKCVNCGSKHRLNFDHRRPYSLGGENTEENIRLLCFHCNQRAWKTSSG